MATFVVAHGAWSAGWGWKKMHPLLRASGHMLWTPTYTGIGERSHLANPQINLDTHIADVLGVLEFENLTDVSLIGHSYGGMVATGVADRARERIARLIYIDAFVPRDGQSVVDLLPPAVRAQRKPGEGSDNWRIPPMPMPLDTPEADRKWAEPRRVPQPLQTFEQKITLSGELTLPRDYIYCTRHAPDDRFRPFYQRARTEGWGAHEIDASHNPHITCPDVLAALLDRIAR